MFTEFLVTEETRHIAEDYLVVKYAEELGVKTSDLYKDLLARNPLTVWEWCHTMGDLKSLKTQYKPKTVMSEMDIYLDTLSPFTGEKYLGMETMIRESASRGRNKAIEKRWKELKYCTVCPGHGPRLLDPADKNPEFHDPDLEKECPKCGAKYHRRISRARLNEFERELEKK